MYTCISKDVLLRFSHSSWCGFVSRTKADDSTHKTLICFSSALVQSYSAELKQVTELTKLHSY